MKYIIFGAGESGKRALYGLCSVRVHCFADNYKGGSEFEGLSVISFDELKRVSNNYIIVLASENYRCEMEQQLIDNGIYNYFVYNDQMNSGKWNIFPNYMLHNMPEYVSYTRRLSVYDLQKYKKIAVFGTNEYLPLLISEIIIQSGQFNVSEIICEDESLVTTNLMGINCVTWEKSLKQFDCLIINKMIKYSPILSFDESNYDFDIIQMYEADDTEKSFVNENLKKYKDIYKGKRAFVIGNGPSLKIEDLDALHKNNEICFGVNKVFRAYDKTAWRADYLCFTDTRVLDGCIDEIKKIDCKMFITDAYVHNNLSNVPRIKNGELIHLIYEGEWPHFPHFSFDVTRGVYDGGTVVYDIGLQMAMYMGFSEIYLLGVDHSYSKNVVDNANYFIDNYFNEAEQSKRVSDRYAPIIFDADSVNMSYESAEKYSRKKGVKIYNATRGGKLEVFERVNFDELFD